LSESRLVSTTRPYPPLFRARPGQPGPSVETTEIEQMLPEGAEAGREVQARFEVVSTDPAKKELTVKSPAGETRTIKVVAPAMERSEEHTSELQSREKHVSRI